MTKEIIKLSRSAVRQALRFFCNLTYNEIAKIEKVSTRSAYESINAKNGVLKWDERGSKEKKEAIKEAKKIIKIKNKNKL